jgi:hypothetical protein
VAKQEAMLAPGGGMNQMPIAFSLQKGTRGAVFLREERGEWGKVK